MQLYDSDEDGNYISTTGDKILAQLDKQKTFLTDYFEKRGEKDAS